MSICCYTGIYDFIELESKKKKSVEGRDVWGGRSKGEERKEAVSSEDRNSALIFVSNVSPSTYGPGCGL